MYNEFFDCLAEINKALAKMHWITLPAFSLEVNLFGISVAICSIT